MEFSLCKLIITGKDVNTLSKKGADAINKVSVLKELDIHVSEGQQVHIKCRKDFTRDEYIYKKRKSIGEEEPCSSKRLSRSELKFDIKSDCIFCCTPDPYKGRKKEFVLVPSSTIKITQSIKEICETMRKNDSWAIAVMGRMNSINDMRADDAVYHNQCSVNFRTGKQIPLRFSKDVFQKGQQVKEKKLGRPKDDVRLIAFQKVVTFFEDNDDEQVTITDLTSHMGNLLEQSDVEPYDVRYMKQKLVEHFGDDLVISNVNGKADVATLRPKSSKILQEFYSKSKQGVSEDDKLKLILAAADIIKHDIKDCNT